MSKKSNKISTEVFFLFTVILIIFAQGCVVGFTNAQNHVPVLYSKIYLPAAIDYSIYSGNSSRLTYAIRNVLANRRDIQLTVLEDARVALQVKILDRLQSINAVDDCHNLGGTSSVASGAFTCSAIHPELSQSNPGPTSFNQPAVSPRSESISLVVDAKAIDLNNGHILWAKKYVASNISPTTFDEIGDAGDNRTHAYTAQTPDLHSLRYQEAIDNAVKAYSNKIADDIKNSLISSLPTN